VKVGTVSSDLFSFEKPFNAFFSENDLIHDLIGDFNEGEEGFYMVSQKTGERAKFVLTELKTDKDGEIWCWKFVAYHKDKELVALVYKE